MRLRVYAIAHQLLCYPRMGCSQLVLAEPCLVSDLSPDGGSAVVHSDLQDAGLLEVEFDFVLFDPQTDCGLISLVVVARVQVRRIADCSVFARLLNQALSSRRLARLDDFLSLCKPCSR